MLLGIESTTAQYAVKGSTGVLGIHSVLIPNSDKILLWNRRHRDGTPYQPGIIGRDGNPEVTAVLDTNTGVYEKKVMRVAPFCSGGSLLANGGILVAGGDEGLNQTGITNGLRAIRVFRSGKWETKSAIMAAPRWYPTQVTLPNAMRTLILGGAVKDSSTPVWTAEVYDAQQNRMTPQRNLTALKKYGAIYPTAYVLPWKPSRGDADIFLFNCYGGVVMSVDGNGNYNEWRQLPTVPLPSGGCSATSSGAPAVMLMLTPENGYVPEVVMFGGSGTVPGDGKCRCDTPALDKAYRINVAKHRVDANDMKWDVDTMPGPRNMADGILLPNGNIVIVGGVRFGRDSQARSPVLAAWLYKPGAPKGKRFSVLGSSQIPRLYHSSSLLLPDGSIFVSGSELNECTAQCKKSTLYKYEFRSERFYPPYFFNKGRPVIKSVSITTARLGGNLVANYDGKVTQAVLIKPGAVTHQVDMGQRGIKLKILSNDLSKKQIIVEMPPPGGFVAQPGHYMLFLNNGSLPCKKAQWIYIEP